MEWGAEWRRKAAKEGGELGLRVWGLGFRGFRVKGLGFRLYGFEGLEFGVG